MNKTTRTSLLVFVLATLVSCVDQTSYETKPVVVATDKGPVTCQLYTKQQVLWDRATHVPTGMTIEQGNEICRREGHRQK